VQPKLLDLTLELIQRCPNSCLFCSSFARIDSQHQLSFGEIMNVSDQAVGLGLRTIGISGGEPLVHPDIKLIIPMLTQKLAVRLYTTGIYFDPRGKAIYFSDWGAFDPSKTTLVFNVQSTDPRVHDRLTCRKGSLTLTAQAIKSAKSKGFQIEVHLVPNLTNLDSIESSVADLCRWGVDQVSFLRLVPQGKAELNASELILNSKKICRLKSLMHSLSQANWGSMKLRFGIPFSGFINGKLSCNAGISKLIIRYDGVVLPCEAFKCTPLESFRLGHIHTNSLSEMLTNGKRHQQLNLLKEKTESSLESCPAQVFWAA
jgi:radical SAM protein with 4Fe4S-binding SPASM domain